MNIEEFRKYCLSKPGVEESLPFDNNTLVFKVFGKIFTMCDIENYTGFVAKCDPERAILLREEFPHHIAGAYHMNKKHWNSIRCDGYLSVDLIKELIDHSYGLVVSGLPKNLQNKLINK